MSRLLLSVSLLSICLWLSVVCRPACLSIFESISLAVCLWLSVSLPIHLSGCLLSVCLHVFLFDVFLPVCLSVSVCLSVFLSIWLPVSLIVCLSVFVYFCLFLCQPLRLSSCLSFRLMTVCLLSACMSFYLWVCIHLFFFWLYSCTVLILNARIRSLTSGAGCLHVFLYYNWS